MAVTAVRTSQRQDTGVWYEVAGLRSDTNLQAIRDASATAISQLRNKIGAGKIIYAADMNQLADFITVWNAHYHAYYDGQRTGVTSQGGFPNSTGVNRTTALVAWAYSSAIGGTCPTVSSGSQIRASEHNDKRTRINTLRTHNHSITDTRSTLAEVQANPLA